jgi:glyoxylase-like metal-dependent hydrolase (beta-lactamase superfamily II)
LIDPVFEQFERDARLIEELELKLCFALETHVHADHVTAQGLLKQRFGACTVISERAGGRSGGRSGKAALALRERGVSRVASLRGGMVEWTRGERAVEYGPPPSAASNRQG